MKALKYYVIPKAEVLDVTTSSPLSKKYFAKYLSHNAENLEDYKQDIFSPNSRSDRQRWKDFTLFHQVFNSEHADFILCQNWLELFYADGNDHGMRLVIQNAIQNFQEQPIVFSWNHDVDSKHVKNIQDLPDSCVILDYNTSAPRANSILLPFWNIETGKRHQILKKHTAGFTGYVGKIPVRCELERAVFCKPGYHWSRDRISEQDWLAQLASFNFAFCPRGIGLSSYRFYEAMHTESVPVLFADDVMLPYPDLDYTQFILRIPERIARDFQQVDAIIQSADCNELRNGLAAVRRRFSLQGVQQEVYTKLKGML